MKIVDALNGVNILAIETSPFIYLVENHPTYANIVDSVFEQAEKQDVRFRVASIALAEVLVKPIANKDSVVQKAYKEMLTNNSRIQLRGIGTADAERAAELRAAYNLRTPDALHLACAINARCDAILTNDMGWKRVTELKVLVIDELEI